MLLVIIIITSIGCRFSTQIKVGEPTRDRFQISGEVSYFNYDKGLWFIDYEIKRKIDDKMEVVFSSGQGDTIYVSRKKSKFSFECDIPDLDSGTYFIVATLIRSQASDHNDISIYAVWKSNPVMLKID